MNIREGRANDAHTIADFQMKMAWETENLKLEEDILKKGVEAVFNDPSKGKYYVAEEDGAVIASLMITYEWSDWRNGLVYWIQSVYVKPEYRKKGVYAKMYAQIKEDVKSSENVRGIRLYVDKGNVNAQKVYEKLGMSGEHYQLYEWMR